MKYLALTQPVQGHWYPSHPRVQAHVDMVRFACTSPGGTRVEVPPPPIAQNIQWQLGNLRPLARPWVFARVMRPLLGLPMTPDVQRGIDNAAQQATPLLQQLEDWLTGASSCQLGFQGGAVPAGCDGFHTFLAGTGQPTIADLAAACEVTQYELMPDFHEAYLAKLPALGAWLRRMKTLPGYAQSHKLHSTIRRKAAELRV